MREILRLLLFIHQKVRNNNFDSIILIDGPEGIGKSTLGFTLLHAHTFMTKGRVTSEDSINFVTTLGGLVDRIDEVPNYSMIVYDEAGDIADAVTRLGKILKRLFQLIRYKNLIVVFILPSVYDLADWLTGRRAKHLFHLVGKGRVKYYSQVRIKRLLDHWRKRRTYTYPVPRKWFDRYPNYDGPLLEGYEVNKDIKVAEVISELKAEIMIKKKKQEPKKMANCLRCGNEWPPKYWPPSKCPSCHSGKWREPVSPPESKDNIKLPKGERLELIKVKMEG